MRGVHDLSTRHERLCWPASQAAGAARGWPPSAATRPLRALRSIRQRKLDCGHRMEVCGIERRDGTQARLNEQGNLRASEHHSPGAARLECTNDGQKPFPALWEEHRLHELLLDRLVDELP